MKKIYLPILLLVCLLAPNINAQTGLDFRTLVAKGNVKSFHIGDTLSVTFNSPIDSVENFRLGKTFFTNLSEDSEFWFSEDLTTVYFVPQFEIDKYYYLIHLGLKLSNGSRMTEPIHIEFATSANYLGYSVSGNVSFKEGNIPAENTIVALLPKSLDSPEETAPAYVTLSDSDGDYSIRGVDAGNYFPVAIKDINGDGEINPSDGDILGKTDSVVVAEGGLENINILLQNFKQPRFARAKIIMDSLRNSPLFQNLKLYFVKANKIDSTGKPSEWNFLFFDNTKTKAFWLELTPFSRRLKRVDNRELRWLRKYRPLGDSINVTALPDSFLARVERRIGRIIRKRHLPDSLKLEVSLCLGDIANGGFRHVLADTNRFFWGLRYKILNKKRNGDNGTSLSKFAEINSGLDEHLFLADYKTGKEVAITGVERKSNSIPQEFLLEQNYPNPFNPSTKIRYSLPSNEFVTLKIYNILGSEVATLVNQKQTSGSYEVNFNGSDLTSGIYFYQISTSKFNQVRKMLLVK
ncbi:MAG: T9SS type A sorting domain-containing protein [Melioribacteraceae bacterium]